MGMRSRWGKNAGYQSGIPFPPLINNLEIINMFAKAHPLALFILIFGLPNVVFGQPGGKEIATETWEKIKASQSTSALSKNIVLHNYPFDGDSLDDSMLDYWNPISETCQDAFIEGLSKAVAAGKTEEFAQEFAAKFGTEDAQADIRWGLACPILVFNSELLLVKDNTNEAFQKFSIAFNKAVVENCLKSKEYYKRLHWFVLWRGDGPFMHENKRPGTETLFKSFDKYFQDVFEGKRDETDLEFWHSTRYFLSLVYLCGWEDNLMECEKPLDSENVQKLARLFAKECFLMTTHIVYCPENAQYVLSTEFRLPPIELPNHPFPEVNYKEDVGKPVFPRISRKLFFEGNFELSFFRKVKAMR